MLKLATNTNIADVMSKSLGLPIREIENQSRKHFWVVERHSSNAVMKRGPGSIIGEMDWTCCFALESEHGMNESVIVYKLRAAC